MNMNMIMQQAQKMQKEMQKATEEVMKETFSTKKDLVEVFMTGDKKVTKIVISEEISADDKEVLEDMIMIAINETIDKIEKRMEEKLGKFKGIPGLF